jgi:serine phosphatase RsbU (regulator of sigma subunit)
MPDSDVLLCALRSGLADVWSLPMASGAMRERLQAIRARAAASVNAAAARPGHGAELERDMRAGRYVQMGMLPQSPLAIGAYRLQYHNVPSMMMSGDFVDYFPLSPRHFLFYLADVAGHGASAAFVTVLLKSFSRRLRREHRPDMLAEPGRILEWVNTELLEQEIDKHVTVILGVVDLETDEVLLVNAGHHPPAIRVSAEGPEILRQKGKPIGLFDTVGYQARSLKMRPGDRLVLFSDGVVDAMGAGSLEDKETRLLAAAAAGADLADMWTKLPVDGAKMHESDDMTCLVVQREG